MKSNTGKKAVSKKSAQPGAPKKTAAKSEKPANSAGTDPEEDELPELDKPVKKTAVRKTAVKSAKAKSVQDEDDEDGEDEADVDDSFDSAEEDEFAVEKEFEEFDLPKSKTKAAAGKKAGKEDDLEIDEEFKDLGFFSEGTGFDDDDDDF